MVGKLCYAKDIIKAFTWKANYDKTRAVHQLWTLISTALKKHAPITCDIVHMVWMEIWDRKQGFIQTARERERERGLSPEYTERERGFI